MMACAGSFLKTLILEPVIPVKRTVGIVTPKLVL